MITILVALGAFLLGVGVTAWVWHHALLTGFQLGRDDRALDPGEHVGRLPVGETSGRHALPEFPAEAEQTVTIPAAPLVEGALVDGPSPEVRA